MDIRQAKISELTQDPNNANQGTERGGQMVRRSLEKLGAGRSVLVDKNGVLIAGNKTTEAAFELGLEDTIIVPTDGTKLVVVQRTDLDLATDAKAKELAIADNLAGEIGLAWDNAVLEELAQDVSLDDWFTTEEMAGWGVDLADIESLDPVEPLTDEDAVPEDVKTRCKKGDIWQLGRHRLMCGDSTAITDVERLMDGKKADMVFTDPPYGVSYAEKNESLNTVGRGNHIQTPIENDHLKDDELKSFFSEAFLSLSLCMKPGCSFYVCAPQGGEQMMMMMMMMSEAGMPMRHELIWVKNNHVLGRADYHYKHEPILYGWKEGAGHLWNGERNKFSVWEFDKPHSSRLHPTMKPVDLIEFAIQNSSNHLDVVVDLFLGSGSTLIACEKTGRTCYGMELSEKYCDVILKRWEDYTGKTAVRVEK